MAPFPVSSSQLGLHKSEISQPRPLRIVKRSKTISGSSTSGESLYGRRGFSGSSLQCKGSPPLAADRPLTVHKLRKGRASVLASSLKSAGDLGCRPSIFDLAERSSDVHDDKDLTPKAKPDLRVTSAGAFLKAEYHGDKDPSDDGSYSLRANVIHHHPVQGILDPSIHVPSSTNTSPKIPERRLSKSKNFLVRALGGRVGAVPQPIPRSNSTMSRNTLIRRFSHRRDSSFESSCSSFDDPACSSSAACSYDPVALEICHTEIKSELPNHQSLFSSEFTHNSPQRDVFVLYPHIIVVPEVPSLDAGLSILWVAIQVTGVLQRAEGNSDQGPREEQFLIGSVNSQQYDLECYGTLHSMRIDLHPGQGCTVLEIIGNLHESKTIRAGETQLVLAKIRLGEIRPSPEGSEDSTEGMIADLQNQLGDIISSYLTVRLTYKHSAFPNRKPLEPLDGMKLRLSRIETEATATIKRRNLESAWSPRTSRTLSNPVDSSPVINLVNTYFPSEKADEVRRRLVHNRSPISIARKFGYWADGSGDNTIDSTQNDLVGLIIDSKITSSFQMPSSRSSFPKSPVSRAPMIEPSLSLDEEDQQIQLESMDPARKIWSEMRLTSRGDRNRHGRASISANHYISTEEERRLTRRSSGNRTFSKGSAVSDTTPSVPFGNLRHDRDKIIEVALRNKRSVGAETLRSFAPSVAGGRGNGKSKSGSATGMGLGIGRGWGWAMPWW